MDSHQTSQLCSRATYPSGETIQGQHVLLKPVSIDEADSLYKNLCDPAYDKYWEFMPQGPFANQAAFEEHINQMANSTERRHFSVIRLDTGEAVGTTCLMRIDVAHAVLEIGYIFYSPLIQRSAMTTECTYLLLKLVFEKLNFRRCEWKCDNRNEPSKRAAERFGFTFEGVFRQHMIIKGKNRDTAWFAIVDSEWPTIKHAFGQWLRPENFDENGQQKARLVDLFQQQ